MSLPKELRQQIVEFVTRVPEPAPTSPSKCGDRVRLRPDWDVWVPAATPQPAILSLMLTCKTLHNDVVYLSASATYELDVMFVPGCGLWPTWTCCPAPSQIRLDTVRVSFRIFHAQNVDFEGGGPSLVAGYPTFAKRFPGIASDFTDRRNHPNPPPGAWNVYRLLVSLLALGSAGLYSPSLHTAHRGTLLSSPPRYTVRRLVLAAATTPDSEPERYRSVFLQTPNRTAEVPSHPTLPYGEPGVSTDMFHFGGPSQVTEDRRYTWTGLTTIGNAPGTSWRSGDRLGLWLANAMWALLDFGRLSRGFGLLVFEGILDHVELTVDGETRPTYHMDDLLARLDRADIDITSDQRAGLRGWRGWLARWKSSRRNQAHSAGDPELDAGTRPTLSFPRLVLPNREDPWASGLYGSRHASADNRGFGG